MFTWLLTKPAVILDFVLGGILIAFGLYFWYANSEIRQLTNTNAQQMIATQIQLSAIKSLDDRLILLQSLNDNFNKSIATIHLNQNITKTLLSNYRLETKASHDPTQAAVFINQRNAKILSELNSLSQDYGVKK